MSRCARLFAVQQRAPRGSAKAVLLEVAQCCNDSLISHASNGYLARATGITVRTVIRALNWLEDHGFLERTEYVRDRRPMRRIRLKIPAPDVAALTRYLRLRAQRRVAQKPVVQQISARGGGDTVSPLIGAYASSPSPPSEARREEVPSRARATPPCSTSGGTPGVGGTGLVSKALSLAAKIKSKVPTATSSPKPRRRNSRRPEPDERVLERYVKMRRSLDPCYEPHRGHVVQLGRLCAVLDKRHVAKRHWPDYVDWIFDAWPRITGDRALIPPPKVLCYDGNLDSWITELPARYVDRDKVHALAATQFDDEPAQRVTGLLLCLIDDVLAGKRLPKKLGSWPDGTTPERIFELVRTITTNIGEYLDD